MYAMGDLLMLLPVVYAMRKKYPGKLVSIETQDQFRDLIGSGLCFKQKDQFSFNLDGTLERDHSGKRWSYQHRVDIYADELGVKMKDCRWTLPEELDKRVDSINIKKPSGTTVAVQLSGSSKCKRILPEAMENIISYLTGRKFNVILIGNEAIEFKVPVGVTNCVNKTSVLQMWKIIRNADILVCFDSGPLWIAHFEQKPILCILGPTRIEERLTKHPLFGSGKVDVLELNKLHNCTACFERAHACGGTFQCMRINQAIVLTNFIEKFKTIEEAIS
jgi:ADP-heptose:LPS heptosyltransferase